MRLSVTVDGELVRKGLQNLADEIPKIGRQQIYLAMLHARTRLSKPGQKPTYPIKWDTEKQRRAFFASDGFGRGIPAKRTGKYTGGWRIEQVDHGYRLENPVGYSKFIGGDAYGVVHSGIHKGRWAVVRDVVEEETKKLPEEIEDKIRMVARREGL